MARQKADAIKTASAALWSEQQQRQTALFQCHRQQLQALADLYRPFKRAAWAADRKAERNPMIRAFRLLTGNLKRQTKQTKQNADDTFTALKALQNAERQDLRAYQKAVRPIRRDAMIQQHKTIFADSMATLKATQYTESQILKVQQDQAFNTQLQVARKAQATVQTAQSAAQFDRAKEHLAEIMHTPMPAKVPAQQAVPVSTIFPSRINPLRPRGAKP